MRALFHGKLSSNVRSSERMSVIVRSPFSLATESLIARWPDQLCPQFIIIFCPVERRWNQLLQDDLLDLCRESKFADPHLHTQMKEGDGRHKPSDQPPRFLDSLSRAFRESGFLRHSINLCKPRFEPSFY